MSVSEPKVYTEEEKLELLQQWHTAKVLLAGMKAAADKEMALRKQVAAAFFVAPEEGTNNLDLNGWTLKLVHKIDRKIDVATLQDTLNKITTEMLYPAQRLVKYSPEVVVAEYKVLPDEVRAVFDSTLVIKEASPTLELIPPKS